MPTRREFLAIAASLAADAAPGLDRKSLVRRHCPTLTRIDPRSPLSVGNGEFAFTADPTGLQSFSSLYERAMPLCTQSQWGWHSAPIPDGLDPAQLQLDNFDTYGRQVGYATSSKGQEPLFNWLRENPHRLNLGRFALLCDGRPIDPNEISGIRQTLDLWNGIIESRFQLRGRPVFVRTACHPLRDALAVVVESPLNLSVALEFPYASTGMTASDWDHPERHRTSMVRRGGRTAIVTRALDDDRYWVRLHGTPAESAGPHRLLLVAREVSFTAEFSAREITGAPLSALQTFAACQKHWETFWSTGGAVSIAASDPRAEELERRVVLSQYLTAIQCAGTSPPQETGLTCNSWFGKFHLEMHWWHAAHFALWGRAPLLERSMAWYQSILPVAREKAKRQGYRGARWPKMTSLNGRDSPSGVGELLIWQQPHPIALASLCYRAHPGPQTLRKYADLVNATAGFMVDYAVLRDGRYVLGPPVIPAQENHPAPQTWNPTFELEYWREALELAKKWPGAESARYEEVRQRLSALPVKDGVYLAHENCPETFSQKNRDHPSMLAALGVLNGEGVNRETMRRTLHRVMKEWRWPETWGWDYPMTAMTAARLGEPETAIDALFLDSPKNTWLPNGHNPQRPDLPLYLPANGGLLYAVAMMASAWNGFPKSWDVHYEGLQTESL